MSRKNKQVSSKCPNGKILNDRLCCVYTKCEKHQVLDKKTGKCKTKKCKIYETLDKKTGKCKTKKCKKLEKINKKTGKCVPDKKAIKEKEKKEKAKKAAVEARRKAILAEKERKKQEKLAEKERKKQEKLAKRKTKKVKIIKATKKNVLSRPDSIRKTKKKSRPISVKKLSNKQKKLSNKQKTLSRFKAWMMKPDSPSLSIAFKTKKDITNVMKIQHDFNALDIKPNDWISDPCYLLKNLKKKLNYKGNWSDRLIKKLDDTIPEAIRDSNIPSKFTLGGDVFQFGSEIGSGSFGAIYSGKTWQKNNSSNKTKIAIKSLHKIKPLEFFTEVIIQNELFCGMRGQWGTGARIPKIYFITKYRSPRSETGWKYIIGMEPLDGDCNDFFRNRTAKGSHFKSFVKALKDIAELLKKLHKKFKFMHRDFHCGNVMYKNLPGDNYRMYVIDFGMSTIQTSSGNWLNRITQTYHYNKAYKFNPTHDLRMLLLSIFSSNTFRYYSNPDLKYIFCYLLIGILRYNPMDNDVLFWNSYADMIHVRDHAFHPDTIIKNMNKLLKEQKLVNKNELKPTKLVITKPVSDDYYKPMRHQIEETDLYHYISDCVKNIHSSLVNIFYQYLEKNFK